MRSQDVIELRERRWVPRDAVAAHTTIAQVHETVSSSRSLVRRIVVHQLTGILSRPPKRTKRILRKEIGSYMGQNTSISRGGSRRGGNHDAAEPPHPDGWSVAGSGYGAHSSPAAKGRPSISIRKE